MQTLFAQALPAKRRLRARMRPGQRERLLAGLRLPLDDVACRMPFVPIAVNPTVVTVQPCLAFIDVAVHVLIVAWVALAILILALLASATERFLVSIDRADEIIFEAIAGRDRASALCLYELYTSRSKNIVVAWVLAVFLGPLGAYAYLGHWGKALLALVTLNGFGAWWIESWFAIPAIVLIEKRELAANSIAQLPFVLSQQRDFTTRVLA